MANTVLEIKLNTKDLTEAIKQIEKYEKDMIDKINLFRKKLAEELQADAQALFDSSVMDNLITGVYKKPNVTVEIENNDNVSVVFTNDEDAIWVEFGAGVYYNGSIGKSPHPKGAEFGYTIGSYGKGFGKGNAWGYMENGELKITRGTLASMPMYNAVKSIISKAEKIAREVWK